MIVNDKEVISVCAPCFSVLDSHMHYDYAYDSWKFSNLQQKQKMIGYTLALDTIHITHYTCHINANAHDAWNMHIDIDFI